MSVPELLAPIARCERPTRPAAAVSDGELIQRIAGGDHDAFAEVHRRFARPVLGLALRKIRDRQRAEDVAQDTFAAIWRFAATYRPERGAGAPWLYAVARNAIVNTARKRIELVSEAVDIVSDEPGLQRQAESDWVTWRIHRALEELPDQQRVPIELAYWGGLSQTEIAVRLNIPLGTVKTRTRSALAALAALLDQDRLDLR